MIGGQGGLGGFGLLGCLLEHLRVLQATLLRRQENASDPEPEERKKEKKRKEKNHLIKEKRQNRSRRA